MRLSEIVGQDAAITVLRDAVERGRLHHALLFVGPKGVGKSSTALALTAFLLCRSRTDDSCGACAACAQVRAGTHPDLRVETLPEDRRDVSIEQVRDIQAALVRRALAGGKKIAIVDEAQALSEPAQNAFLKTLEEPPGDSLLILVAHNATALTPTIRSRCQRVPFGPLSAATIERCLRDRHGRSPEDARLLAAYCEGSLGAALDSDAAALREAADAVERTLEGLDGRRYSAIVEAARALIEQNGPLGLPLLIRVLRQRLRASAGLPLPGDELTRIGKPVSLSSALNAAGHAYRASADIKRNANATIALERMWLEIAATLGG